MGILGKIRDAIVNEVQTIVSSLVDIGYSILATIERSVGIEPERKKKLTQEDKDYIRDELRKQWLELASGEREEIEGVEVDDETYYDTPE